MSGLGRAVSPISVHESSEVADYVFSLSRFGCFNGKDSWDFGEEH